MQDTNEQKDFLHKARAKLSAILGKKMTWRDFAEHFEIHPRALQTYILPDDSKNHRMMPAPVRRFITRELKL